MRSGSSNSSGIMTLIWFLLGAICSWLVNHSAIWAIVHGIFGPFYLLYLCLGFGGGFDAVDNSIDRYTRPETVQQ